MIYSAKGTSVFGPNGDGEVVELAVARTDELARQWACGCEMARWQGHSAEWVHERLRVLCTPDTVPA